MSVDQIISIFQGSLTPLIAVVATYIAWQQWQTNKGKLKLDRYDRRLRIYEEVRKILSIILRDANANNDDLLKFRAAVSEADFLFGPEIPAYLDEIFKRGLKLHSWHEQYRDYTQEKPKNYNHQKVVEGMHHELTWLTDQFASAKQMFRKYLDVGN